MDDVIIDYNWSGNCGKLPLKDLSVFNKNCFGKIFYYLLIMKNKK